MNEDDYFNRAYVLKFIKSYYLSSSEYNFILSRIRNRLPLTEYQREKLYFTNDVRTILLKKES